MCQFRHRESSIWLQHMNRYCLLWLQIALHVRCIRRRYTFYTIICYVHLHASVLSSLATHHATKHDRSDSTALPNENEQLGVGLLQINIVAFTNSLQRRHIIDIIFTKTIHHIKYKQRLLQSYIRVNNGFRGVQPIYSLTTRSLDTRNSATYTATTYKNDKNWNIVRKF